MTDPRAVLLLLVLVMLLGCAAPSRSPSEQRGFLSRSVTDGGEERRYILYVPEGIDLAKPAPVIVFLHGMGECGTDGSRQATVGLAPAVRAHPERWSALILMPQKPDPKKQWEDYDAMVMAQLATVRREYRVDPRRIYLTGLSQGGHGTWTFGAMYPTTWAALAPVCGYGDPGPIAPKITSIPVWAFHGAKDDAVPPAQSEAMVKALVEAGSTRAKLTVFPEANHNSWDSAYGDPDVAEWMLSQRRAPE